MAGSVRVEESHRDLLVHPAGPTELTILYLHGDRSLASVPEAAIDLAGHLAQRARARVVCPRYGSTFPVALREVQAAYDGCRAAGPVVVAGERAGAGLATALLIRLRDSAAAQPRCAVLVSALLDMTLRAPSLDLNASADPLFDMAELRRCVARYAAGTAQTDPLLSPLYANLHGLPPVQLFAAGTDPLLDDSLAFAARAARSGVTVDLRVSPEEASLRTDLVSMIATFVKARAADAPDAFQATSG